ncbi:MAG: ATPase V, partial [Oscillospiraceae bacterium]|nr:ATPase V [Oscillospiraceae bacterium]
MSPMKLVTIAGPLEDFDRTIRHCVINREFHPESALNVMKQVKGLFPFERDNPFAELLRQAQIVSDRTGVALDYREFPEDAYRAEDAAALFACLEERFSSLMEEREALLARIEDDRQILIQLEHVREVNVPLQDFFRFTYVKFRFGRLPRETYAGYRRHIEDRRDVFFFETSQERDFVYGMYMTPRPSADRIDSLFASFQFERIHLSDRMEGTGDEAARSISRDIQASGERVAAIDAELAHLRREESEDFLRCYSFVRYMNDSCETRRFAAHTGESFYILGWVPESEFSEFTKNLDSHAGLNYVVASEDPESLSDLTPPVKLKNARLFRPFEPFVGMYGLPAYNEIDPTPLMAVTYSLLFGAMFGDLGHGAVLALAGLLMWKAKGLWLGRVLIYAGVCSMVFGGAVYGSVFGYGTGYGFDVLRPASNSQRILEIAIYGGAALITLACAMNIVNGIRQRNVSKAVFGASGLAGVCLYWGVVLLVFPFIGFGSSPVGLPVLLAGAALPLLLVFLHEPLAYMAARLRRWRPR